MENSVNGISFDIQNIKPNPDDINIWLIPLDQPIYPKFFQKLSPSQQKNALTFFSKKRYSQYVLCWYAVRKILSQCIGCNIDDINIGYRRMGKPFLEKPHFELDFNISHSERIAFFAISKKRRIGIDLEVLKPLEDIESLSLLIMSKKEYSNYKPLPSSLKTETFYKIWVRKEALLKGIGIGLHYPLEDITIWPISEDRQKKSVLLNLYDGHKSWTFSDLSFQYKGTNYQSSCFQENTIGTIFYHFFTF